MKKSFDSTSVCPVGERIRSSGRGCRILFAFLLFSFLLFSFCAIAFVGCSDEDDPPPKARIKEVFPPVIGADLKFEIISTHTVFRKNAVNPPVRFALSNEGGNIVSIPEWKLSERSNVDLLYAECPEKGGASMIPDEKWRVVSSGSDMLLQNGRMIRSELILAPKNAALVDIPATFVRNFGKSGRFALKGKLALASLKLESPPLEIIVLPDGENSSGAEKMIQNGK